MKICSKCKKEKLLIEFFRDRRTKTWFGSACKDCVKQFKEGRWKHLDNKSCVLTEKFCARCKNTKPIDDFSRDRSHPTGKDSYCRDCKKDIRDIRKDRAIIYHRLKVYGINNDEYEGLLIEQNFRCAIDLSYVHDPSKKSGCLDVDHCHNCDKIRGLLSGIINRAIGLFNEDPSLLRAAANYLESHNCLEEKANK